MERTEIVSLYKSTPADGTVVTVCGWAKNIRDSKNIGFIALSDGGCFKTLQVVLEAGKLANYDEVVNTGLYTINLAAMGFSSTMSLVKTETIFSLAKKSLGFLGSWYKLVLVGVIIALACAAMLGFLGTRLGLSIRATGDNTAMVRASSINPAFTITVGLCVSGALCALSGGLLAQYQKSCDINVGTGMVTIALASLIIGETLVGKRTMLRRILGVVFGSCLYRFIVAVALRFNVPAAAMKLVSAIIVAVAISMPAIMVRLRT